MSKFSGILICSDIDGTFAGETFFEENISAVKYFIQNGGKFTFITGRAQDYLRQEPFCNLINAPAGIFNGGLIYDYKTETVLKKIGLDFTVQEFMQAIQSLPECTKVHIFDQSGAHIIIQGTDSIPPSLLAEKPLKIVCNFATEQIADEFKQEAKKSVFFKNNCISKSWSLGVEFNGAGASKGNALDFLKSYLKDIHTAIGVGNYDNDIPLIQHADMGVAVGDAQESVKQVADIVVKPCAQYAIKDLIEILEKTTFPF